MLRKGCAVLVCLLFLTLTACGAKTPETPGSNVSAVQEDTAQIPAAAEETEAATVPTLSPEEILIASLPETVRQAYDVGIVELTLLEDLDRVCTTDEAAQIIQNVIRLHYDTGSQMMDRVPDSEFGGKELTKHWMSVAMALALIDQYVEYEPSEDFAGDLEYLLTQGEEKFMREFVNGGFYLVTENVDQNHFWLDADAVIASEEDQKLVPDWLEIIDDESPRIEEEGWVRMLDYGFWYYHWVLWAGDRTTGEKLMAGDRDTPFDPRGKLTVQEAVEIALRFHNYIPPEAQMLPYDEVPAFDSSIITEDLLNKETTLPEASCANLPKEWKGVSMGNLSVEFVSSPQADLLIQEKELQVIKDAGFNYVQIYFDFHYYLSDIQDASWCWTENEKEGQMNETRLKELDQIIAWCMERDIHVDLCCVDTVGWPQVTDPMIFAKKKNAEPMAEQWTVLARRYADIPNTYLSFTLHYSPAIRSDKIYGDFFTPVVEAIRAESPDRCIIANAFGDYFPKSMAELGVAISSKVDWPKDFNLKSYESSQYQWETLFREAQWPYDQWGTLCDAEGAMGNALYGEKFFAPDDCAEQAKEYGVGYMVNNWDPVSGGNFFRERYQDETMKNYLTDFYNVLDSRGYGWCYGDWFGFVGIVCAYPTVKSTTYTQVENLPLYIDDEMFAWFQELNAAY